MVQAKEKGDPVVLRKYRQVPRCLFCGRYEGKVFRGHIVCEACLNEIREKY